jgi:hypothetical protein
MSSPTPQAIALIGAKVDALPGGWAGNSDAQVVAALNAPSVANPTPQGTVPKPFVAADLVDAAAQGSRAALASFVTGAAPFIIAQDAAHLAAGIDALVSCGTITSGDAAAMKAVLTATQPDPSYPAQIGWAQANLGRPLDQLDASVARHGGY